MASRFRSLSKPSLTLLKSTLTKPVPKPKPKPNPSPSFLTPRSSPPLSRSFAQMGALQSLLPLHSAVSSARLTSCLGIDSVSSRSLSQEMWKSWEAAEITLYRGRYTMFQWMQKLFIGITCSQNALELNSSSRDLKLDSKGKPMKVKMSVPLAAA
ncbi:protein NONRESPONDING TO OXYLIPINS 2, mitochondrial isoform X2 [Malania oleifera]|uniref:protein NONRESPONDING TO OXYLIPINS 2, mitochondrial isoform X2 n=1 Tax=Malania oleifera TaxID=397392 RepID=UPI0025ADD659|nr:protein NONRESPONDING TO OXYLIPINS 2, mitochondrial isoform X2 [Malania oleifera]